MNGLTRREREVTDINKILEILDKSKVVRIGLVDGDEIIRSYLDIAEGLLENCKIRDGYYAFVCEKCASVFGYYGRFLYEKSLYDRAQSIYAENRAGGR